MNQSQAHPFLFPTSVHFQFKKTKVNSKKDKLFNTIRKVYYGFPNITLSKWNSDLA
jgi:hypothetical protein